MGLGPKQQPQQEAQEIDVKLQDRRTKSETHIHTLTNTHKRTKAPPPLTWLFATGTPASTISLTAWTFMFVNPTCMQGQHNMSSSPPPPLQQQRQHGVCVCCQPEGWGPTNQPLHKLLSTGLKSAVPAPVTTASNMLCQLVVTTAGLSAM